MTTFEGEIREVARVHIDPHVRKGLKKHADCVRGALIALQQNPDRDAMQLLVAVWTKAAIALDATRVEGGDDDNGGSMKGTILQTNTELRKVA